jgi:hypothetical protein
MGGGWKWLRIVFNDGLCFSKFYSLRLGYLIFIHMFKRYTQCRMLGISSLATVCYCFSSYADTFYRNAICADRTMSILCYPFGAGHVEKKKRPTDKRDATRIRFHTVPPADNNKHLPSWPLYIPKALVHYVHVQNRRSNGHFVINFVSSRGLALSQFTQSLFQNGFKILSFSFDIQHFGDRLVWMVYDVVK